ncbi:sigma-70 family RNA polymerase sigma factor [Clostridium ganghwense]|uniref:Sigma-70 family RNA polymerase sigma factor n=1 Tax=Clostridium ganghwense TaxID=312089 RepID=A0ABT4CK13_9CLOT|nr:sigma-70 family RNA polymerase sigma factor [Clostridium ganghwense]MCY6369382.1 sigma-70 family RNA polymerase sigma factor [Clostridium ganghwense]
MKITEENFVPQLKKKNERALEYVIDNYGWIIKSIVKKHLYNLESHQEECINDILLGIWNNIDSFNEDKSTFKNWAAGIAKYKTIDCRRKYLRDLKNEDIDQIEIVVEDDVCKEVIKNDLDRDLDELLNCLKKQDKKLFIKLYVKEQEIDCVSKEIGLKREIIYNRISRGKRKLKKMFNIMESRG